jgi:hypothetical protein
MKRLLFIFLLFPCCCIAQNGPVLFGDRIPAGAKAIVLPEMKWGTGFSGRHFLVTQDSVYKALFHDSVHHRLPAIDFSRYELHGAANCIQCATVCGNRPQCHRNACRYVRSWYLLEKATLQKVEPDTILTGYCMVHDTIVGSDTAYVWVKKYCAFKNYAPDFETTTLVLRTEFADCLATFTHSFYLDTARHCLVWRLGTADGGCRGGDLHTFAAALPRLPEGYRVVFEEYDIPAKD